MEQTLSKTRSSDEIRRELAKLEAEADSLNKENKSDEDTTRFEEVVGQMESLEKEHKDAVARERVAAFKERQNAPIRQAPVFAKPKEGPVSLSEGLGRWLGAFGPKADKSPESAYKARAIGLDINNGSCQVPIVLKGLNFKERAVLSKGGSGTGAELLWQSYSDKVTEYLTLTSPLLGYLSTETTEDGNPRSYFVIDDTALKSSYTTASSGTETNPTIPDRSIATAAKVVNTFDITSGYQKVTWQELRDSYVDLESKIAKANSNQHARQIESEVIAGTGNGTTGVQGILTAATVISPVAAWTQDVVRGALRAIPAQYRKNAVFVSNDTTQNNIDISLRDDIGRSLFGTTVADGLEFDTLFGKKYIVTQYMDDDTLLVFVPEYYQLRIVANQIYRQFVEKFFPMVAFSGLMSIGGCWLGPATAAQTVSLS